MKNIIKNLALLFVAILIFSCQKNTLFEDQPDIKLVEIYSLTNLGDNNPTKINIYKEEAIIIEFKSETKLTKYVSSNYTDNSTDTDYNFSVTKLVPETQEDDSIINQEIIYTVTGDKTTGMVTLSENNNGTISNYNNVAISIEEIYN
ncbi:hypothetical protein [Wenyingzhuangia sp. 2_MG-2023]|uniref:hypothetical protein n=1 Tax=Wenyingzhuangia sp. 2_MG-2023 TaxID=3062639 RepID=UPI0026E23BF5|nr:hypothetical protein [Wenyingzhuangia sp. 2_MG-2023]MDO6738767.1 hypothetical protein [Wenyingzhuangia sp. 2_MG-2023]